MFAHGCCAFLIAILNDPQIKTAQHAHSTTFIPLDTEVYEPFDT